MIKRLKKNLYLLLVISLMSIFSIVFCLMIQKNISAKEKSELAYFNRMTTFIILQLEHDSDYKSCFNSYEKKLNMYFKLLSENENCIYQSEFLKINSDVIKTFLRTQFDAKEIFSPDSEDTNKNNFSSQGGTYQIKSSDGKKYYCVNCVIVTNDENRMSLTAVKKCSDFWEFLKPEIVYYFCVWFGVFFAVIFLSWILIKKAVKPTEQAFQSQKNFIAAASHECKSPLAAILSSAELIASEPDISDSTKKYVQVIDSEVSRMSRLIGDLLELSSLDAGNRAVHIEEINLDMLLITLYTKFEPVCLKKNITLNLNIPKDPVPPIHSDAERLEQILNIILDNAVSYSPPKSEITINAATQKNELIISVIDHGSGISNKDKPFIFDRFYRSDKSRSAPQHYGLGLSIAKELVEMLGGKITLTDTDGGGCTFRIYLSIC